MIREMEKVRARVLRLYGMQKIGKVQHDAALGLIALFEASMESPETARYVKHNLPVVERVSTTHANNGQG